MSLYNRTFLYPGEQQVNDGDSLVLPSETEVDVSEVWAARVVARIVGKDAATAGSLRVHLFGVMRGWEVEIDSFVVIANGLTPVLGHDNSVIRGFEKIITKLSYNDVPGQYVKVQVQVGIPHISAPK